MVAEVDAVLARADVIRGPLPQSISQTGATFLIFGLTKNYDLVAVLAMIASIALPQSLLNW